MKRSGLPLAAVAALVPSLAFAGQYAPLQCADANSAAEKTICHSYALGQDEARMATLYAIATSLVAMGRRGDLQDQQRTWIKARENCGADAACLAKSYAKRIDELNGVIAGIAARGPF